MSGFVSGDLCEMNLQQYNWPRDFQGKYVDNHLNWYKTPPTLSSRVSDRRSTKSVVFSYLLAGNSLLQ